MNCSRLSDDGRGKFRMENAILPNRGEVDHGKEVDLECDEGYFRYFAHLCHTSKIIVLKAKLLHAVYACIFCSALRFQSNYFDFWNQPSKERLE